MGMITSANAVLSLQILPLFLVPQQLQGFGADDIYNIPSIKSVETKMGVDGKQSSGFVFVSVPQDITLQADSLSNRIFDTWWTSMQAAKDVYVASGVTLLPSIASKFIHLNGSLTGYTPAPPGKRTLMERVYQITWESIVPMPA